MIKKVRVPFYYGVCDNCGKELRYSDGNPFECREDLLHFAEEHGWFINDPVDGKDFCGTDCLLDYRAKKKGIKE